jgi:hypothetical protein
MATDPRLIGGRRTGPDRKLDPSQELKAVSDYIAGKKLLVILEAHSITKPTLYAILDRHGITRTRKSAPPQPGEAA